MKYVWIALVAGAVGILCGGCVVEGLKVNRVDTKPSASADNVNVPVPASPTQ
jgi:hypothetical protein